MRLAGTLASYTSFTVPLKLSEYLWSAVRRICKLRFLFNENHLSKPEVDPAGNEKPLSEKRLSLLALCTSIHFHFQEDQDEDQINDGMLQPSPLYTKETVLPGA